MFVNKWQTPPKTEEGKNHSEFFPSSKERPTAEDYFFGLAGTTGFADFPALVGFFAAVGFFSATGFFATGFLGTTLVTFFTFVTFTLVGVAFLTTFVVVTFFAPVWCVTTCLGVVLTTFFTGFGLVGALAGGAAKMSVEAVATAVRR
ncbi:hypothetical protein H5T87_05615 [bacterium]|nr:hypothetical protein [bacterium]